MSGDLVEINEDSPEACLRACMREAGNLGSVVILAVTKADAHTLIWRTRINPDHFAYLVALAENELQAIITSDREDARRGEGKP